MSIKAKFFCAEKWMAWTGLLAIGLLPLAVQAARTYRFTGEVIAVHKNTVTVRRGTEEAEFARPSNASPVHVGERITVIYGMDAKQFLASPQAPGSVPDENNLDQHVIQDDRAFFNAKNQAAPSSKVPPS